jgi:hypothetical protein
MIAREILAGSIFFGSYETLRDKQVLPGVAGSVSAVTSLVLTYALDTARVRAQVASTASASVRGNLHLGLGWALLKCTAGNAVALTVFEAVRTRTPVI